MASSEEENSQKQEDPPSHDETNSIRRCQLLVYDVNGTWNLGVYNLSHGDHEMAAVIVYACKPTDMKLCKAAKDKRMANKSSANIAGEKIGNLIYGVECMADPDALGRHDDQIENDDMEDLSEIFGDDDAQPLNQVIGYPSSAIL